MYLSILFTKRILVKMAIHDAAKLSLSRINLLLFCSQYDWNVLSFLLRILFQSL
jgi:hypothetical protein